MKVSGDIYSSFLIDTDDAVAHDCDANDIVATCYRCGQKYRIGTDDNGNLKAFLKPNSYYSMLAPRIVKEYFRTPESYNTLLYGIATGKKRISELAEDITKFAETKYPGITKPVVRKDYARFNQFTSDNHLLLEVGGNANSIEEAKASIPYIAEIIDEYFKKQGI